MGADIEELTTEQQKAYDILLRLFEPVARVELLLQSQEPFSHYVYVGFPDGREIYFPLQEGE